PLRLAQPPLRHHLAAVGLRLRHLPADRQVVAEDAEGARAGLSQGACRSITSRQTRASSSGSQTWPECAAKFVAIQRAASAMPPKTRVGFGGRPSSIAVDRNARTELPSSPETRITCAAPAPCAPSRVYSAAASRTSAVKRGTPPTTRFIKPDLRLHRSESAFAQLA